MVSPEYTITLTSAVTPEVESQIISPLVAYNREMAGPSNASSIYITLRDEGGLVVGGLAGETSRGWLFIDYLVVPERSRGGGLGSKIVKMAETEAVKRGCVGCWLNTFEFQSRGFYESLGYSCFGELKNHPPGYSRYFMQKPLPSLPSDA